MKQAFIGWVRRLTPYVIVLAGVIGGFSLLLVTQARQRRTSERKQAEARLDDVLRRGKQISAEYVRERQADREQAKTRLRSQAVNLANDVQVFVQAALVDRQAMRISEEASRMRKANEDLLREIETLRREKEEAENALEKQTATDPESKALDLGDGPLLLGTEDVKETLAENSPDPAENQAPSTTVESSSAAAESPAEGKKILSVDTAEDDLRWAEKVLNDCGPDLAKMLPETASLTVAEVGGRVLLRLDEGADAAMLTGESSRTILFQAGGRNCHWAVHIRVAEDVPDALPPAEEFSRRLTARLGLTHDDTLQGYLIDDEGTVVESFPHREKIETDDVLGIRRHWIEIGSNRSGRLEAVSALSPSPWGLAAQIEIYDPSISERMFLMMQEDWRWCGAIVLLIVAGCIAVSRSQGYATGDSTKRKSGRIRLVKKESTENGDVVYADLSSRRRPTEIGGSLHRLQAQHREDGRGSRILDHARSQLLKDLARKIRPAEQSTPTPEDSTSPASRNRITKSLENQHV